MSFSGRSSIRSRSVCFMPLSGAISTSRCASVAGADPTSSQAADSVYDYAARRRRTASKPLRSAVRGATASAAKAPHTGRFVPRSTRTMPECRGMIVGVMAWLRAATQRAAILWTGGGPRASGCSPGSARPGRLSPGNGLLMYTGSARTCLIPACTPDALWPAATQLVSDPSDPVGHIRCALAGRYPARVGPV